MYDIVGFYDTGNSSERYARLVFPSYRTVFLQHITVNPGDILDVHAEGQVTNDRTGGTNTMVVSQLRLLVNGVSYEISEANGENVDKQRHHMKVTNVGLVVVPPDVPMDSPAQVVSMWRADSTDLTPPTSVRVDKDYGRMTTRHYRPCG
jgi:hypothetical protein